jgi:hypothetical protein
MLVEAYKLSIWWKFFCSLVVDFDNEDEYDPEQFAGNQVPILIVGTKNVSRN